MERTVSGYSRAVSLPLSPERSAGGPSFVIRAAIALMPLAAVLGPYAPAIPVPQVWGFPDIGRALFGFRVLALLLVYLALVIGLAGGTWALRLSPARRFLALSVVWVLWGCALVVVSPWTPVIVPAADQVVELITIGLGAGVALALVGLGGWTNLGLRALRSGWTLAFLAAGAVALWEGITGNHLPNPALAHIPAAVLKRGHMVVSTTGNANHYAAFLTLSSPFLVWSALEARTRVTRAAYVGLSLLGLFGVVFTGSEACFLGMVAEVCVITVLFLRRRPVFVLVAPALIACLIWAWPHLPYDPTQFTSDIAAVSGLGFGGVRGAFIRGELAMDGLWMTVHSYGLGMGPASFSPILASGRAPYAVPVMSPHDEWVEILSEYGFVIFVGFVWWLLGVARTALRALRSGTNRDVGGPLAIVVGMTGYVFAAIANSGFVQSSINWAFLASILTTGCAVSALPTAKADPGRVPAVRGSE